jgi:hypothetical protein
MRDNIREALDRYANTGCPVGGFLTAFLENNLMEAIGRADNENRRDLVEIAGYVYNEMPGNCHGSPEIVRDWIMKHKQEREAGLREPLESEMTEGPIAKFERGENL